MCVPINGPSYMLGDNISVVNGASTPQCKISKKYLFIFYHDFQEA